MGGGGEVRGGGELLISQGFWLSQLLSQVLQTKFCEYSLVDLRLLQFGSLLEDFLQWHH